MAAESYVVKDKYDPSNQGMFSSAGRFTTEKYIIFQRKDEILYNKKMLKSVSDVKFEKPSTQAAQKPKEVTPVDTQGIKTDVTSPFYRQTSREYVLKLQQIKNPPKPVGYYKPKYKEIDKNQHLAWNILKVYQNKTIPLKTVTQVDNLEEQLQRPIPEKPLKKLQGALFLDKCIDRNEKQMYNQRDNPHEKRFELVPLTETWSNIKKIKSFNLTIAKGRDEYKPKENQPDYNPNNEFGKKQLGTSGPLHETRPKRKPFDIPSNTNNEDRYDYDFYKINGSNVWNNLKGFEFNKQIAREIDEKSKLPCYMQKHLNTRTNLTGLTRKMLEQNHYMDGRFLSTDSVFGKSHMKFNKKDLKLDENEESIEMENI